MSNLSKKLRRLRQNTGKTQIDVAWEMRKLFGSKMSQSQLSAYERGVSRPCKRNITMLARYYNVRAEWLDNTR